jgi:hypothetical protein
MPLSYDQISAITQKKFIPKLYDNIFDSNPLLQRAKKKWYEKLDGGTSILVPLNYATTSASAWYSGADTLDTTDNDVMTAAEYSWKQIYANISINRADELKNSGDSQILSLVKNKVKIAEHTLLDSLGTGIYSSGTNAKSIVGLGSAQSTSNTVGGISQSTYSWWQPKLDTSTTTLTIPAMQSRFTACTVDSNKPSVIVGGRSNYDRFYNLLQPQQRFMDSSTAEGGFESLMFNGAPFIPDSHASSSRIDFLNEDYLHLFVHKDEDFRFEPFAKPINQNVKVAKIYWMGALGFSNLRLLGALTAITA